MKNSILYLRENIDESAFCEPFDRKSLKKNLSLQLISNFKYYKGRVLGEDVLFLKPKESLSASALQNAALSAEAKFSVPSILILDEITPYMMKKFLSDRTAFLVPGKCLNLPFLALQIKNERLSAARKTVRVFNPGTQLIYLYILYSKETVFTIDSISSALSISKMTALRGLNDLASVHLLSFEITGKTGRKKEYRVEDRKTFYSAGKKYLNDPVRDVVYVDKLPSDLTVIKSDLTALAEQTMLAEPEQKHYAMYYKEKEKIENCIVPADLALEEHLPVIQLLKYDPSLLTDNEYIDPITLVLSLEEQDERIEQAIDELLSNCDWYISEENNG